LKKWKYLPTYLNDQPIAVEMIVTVTFQLGSSDGEGGASHYRVLRPLFAAPLIVQ
jgi:hypothetical protein